MQTRKLYNLEAEQSFLGCILLDENVHTAIDEVNELDFYEAKHQIIFNSMKIVYKNNLPVDFVTLTDDLERRNLLDSVGGIEYISHLTNYVPSASNYEFYLNIIKEFSSLRLLVKEMKNISTQIDGGESFESVKSSFENSIKKIEEFEIDADVEHIGSASDNQFEKIKNAINGIFTEKGIPTGFPTLDDNLYGMQNGNFIVIGARAGIGKTAMAIDILHNTTVKNNKKALFFSLEMPKEEIMHRLYAIDTQINGMDLRRGTLKSGDFDKVRNAKERFNKSGFFIDDTSNITVKKMMLKARKFKRKGGLDFIIVDYLQFIKPSGKGGNRFQDVGEIARDLKQMARQLNIPVIALAQLNRAIDKEDKEPVMADLRESGEIENNADVIMFLHSKSKDMSEVRDVALIIAKNRNGARAFIKMNYKGATFTFNEIDKPKDKAIKQIELTPKELEEVEKIF